MREDWIEVELGEVCQINMGQSPPSSTYNTDKKGLPFFQGKAEFTELHPIVEKWCTEPTKIAEINDILLSVRAPVGATNVANQKCAIGRGLAAISYKYDYKYILAYLRLIEKKLDSQGTGTTFRAISGSILKSQIIPLAPLPIQRAIVLKIENLFASLDKGIADLKTAQEQLKVYRQAVLKKAFEGRFDFAQRPTNNLKDGELPHGWKWVTFNDVCIKIGDIDHKMPKQVDTGGFPYISTKDFTDDLKISFEQAKYISKEDFNFLARKIKPEKGDIIFPRYGTIGKNILVDFEKDFLVSYSCAVVKPNHDKIDSKYLFYFSLSPVSKDEIKKYVVETTQANIGIASIKRFVLPLPKDKTEQHAIVREIESRLSVCDKVEQSIAEALEKAEALRQSILKKAFEGRLLSGAEVTACKQEADYEPAAKLLERIKEGKTKNDRDGRAIIQHQKNHYTNG